MNVPIAGCEYLLEKSSKASFVHAKQLNILEEHKTLKIGRTLKKASLYPSNIARVSSQHPLSKSYALFIKYFRVYCTTF